MGGGWSANRPEPRQAAHSQIRPPPPAHALPFKAAGRRGHRAARRTRRASATLPRRLTREPGLAAREGSGYSFREGVSPGTAPSFPRGDHGTPGCALALGARGPHLRQHLVAAICRRTGRALCAFGVPPSPGVFFLVRAAAGSALHSEDRSRARAAARAGTGGAGLGLRRPLAASPGLAGSDPRGASAQPPGPFPASRPRAGPASSWAESGRGGGA